MDSPGAGMDIMKSNWAESSQRHEALFSKDNDAATLTLLDQESSVSSCPARRGGKTTKRFVDELRRVCFESPEGKLPNEAMQPPVAPSCKHPCRGLVLKHASHCNAMFVLSNPAAPGLLSEQKAMQRTTMAVLRQRG